MFIRLPFSILRHAGPPLAIGLVGLFGTCAAASVEDDVHQLHAYFVAPEVTLAPPSLWSLEIKKLSPTKQRAILDQLRVYPGVEARLRAGENLLAHMARATVEQCRTGVAAELRDSVARLQNDRGRNSTLTYLNAQTRAAAEMGVRQLDTFDRAENLDLRRRWQLATDQLIRSDAYAQSRIDSRALDRWRSSWTTRLKNDLHHVMAEWINDVTRDGYLDVMYRAADDPAAGLVKLDIADVRRGFIHRSTRPAEPSRADDRFDDDLFGEEGHADDDRDDEDHEHASLNWNHRWHVRVDARDYEILLVYDHELDVVDHLGFELRDYGSPDYDGRSAFAHRWYAFYADWRVHELTRLLDAISELRGPVDAMNLRQWADDLVRDLDSYTPTVAGALEFMVGGEDLGHQVLFAAVANLRAAAALRDPDQTAFDPAHWLTRDRHAARARLPVVRLNASHPVGRKPRPGQTGARPGRFAALGSPVPGAPPPVPARPPLPPIRNFEVEAAYDFDTYPMESVFQHEVPAHPLDWDAARPDGGPADFTLTSRRPQAVRADLVAVPTPRGHHLTGLTLTTRGRTLREGVDYGLRRDQRGGAYAVYFLSPGIREVFVSVAFARDPGAADVALPTVPGGRLRSVANELARSGEKILSRAMADFAAAGADVSVEDLNALVEWNVKYTYFDEPNPTLGAGSFAAFAPFLDDHGQLCGQCEHFARLLADLLNATFTADDGWKFRVTKARLVRGRTLAKDGHAVVDVYYRDRFVRRLNPVVYTRDQRAPTALDRRRARAEKSVAEAVAHLVARQIAMSTGEWPAHLAAADPFPALYRWATLTRRWAEGTVTEREVRDRVRLANAAADADADADAGKRSVDVIDRLEFVLNVELARAERWADVPTTTPRDERIRRLHAGALADLNTLAALTIELAKAIRAGACERALTRSAPDNS